MEPHLVLFFNSILNAIYDAVVVSDVQLSESAMCVYTFKYIYVIYICYIYIIYVCVYISPTTTPPSGSSQSTKPAPWAVQPPPLAVC